MRAAVFKRALGRLVVEQHPDPSPEAGELLIRIARAGICGSEIHATSHPARPVGGDTILGHEICGEVIALGKSVERFRVGDRIVPMPYVGCGRCSACLAGKPHLCPGARLGIVAGYCEYTRVGQNECIRVPAEVSDEEAALIEPLAVGLQGVRKAELAVGNRVLVTGAGPIGLAAAFWARRLGASRVVVMANSARRKQFALGMGATHFIAQQEVADATEAVRDVLGGAPDVVIEAAGVPGAIAEAIAHVKPASTVISLGLCWGGDHFCPSAALMKEVRLQFSLCYARSDFEYCATVMAEGDHRPRIMITATVDFDALPAKFESLRGPSADCMVMIAPGGI